MVVKFKDSGNGRTIDVLHAPRYLNISSLMTTSHQIFYVLKPESSL